MGIVVDDGDAAHFALVLETPVSTAEVQKSFLNILHGKAELLTKGYGRQGIGSVVDSGNRQREPAKHLITFYAVKGSVGKFIKGNVFGHVISRVLQSAGDDLTGKVFGDLLIIRNIAADDQGSVSGQLLCKQLKGMADIVQVLEEIQMVRVNIQDDADLGEKAQKAVGVLTGLCDKGLGPAHTDIAVNGRQYSAHRDRRVGISLQKDV